MRIIITLTLTFLASGFLWAQDNDEHYIRTIFNNHGPRAAGGYVAFSNKFTTINGDYANMVELYGGWYIDHRFLLGLGGAATTNYIPVPYEHSINNLLPMSYEFAQGGLMTEYVIASDRAIHVAFQAFAGGGYTLQYERFDWHDDDNWDQSPVYEKDGDFLWVFEPGVKIEVNIFRWLRFSPGVSYRITDDSDGAGLGKEALDGASLNLTLKIGKF